MEIRVASPSDYIVLRNLWHEEFGDSEEYIDNLYNSLNATGYVLLEDEDIKSSLTVFSVGIYQDKIVNEIYAVCTKPDARYKGFASKLIKSVRDQIASENKIVMVCPAEETLIPFYEKLEFRNHFYISHASMDAEKYISTEIKRNGSAQYNNYREKYLSKIPHIELNHQFTDYIISEDEIKAQQINLSKDAIVQGMIYSKDEIRINVDTYPYFGFPMK